MYSVGRKEDDRGVSFFLKWWCFALSLSDGDARRALGGVRKSSAVCPDERVSLSTVKELCLLLRQQPRAEGGFPFVRCWCCRVLMLPLVCVTFFCVWLLSVSVECVCCESATEEHYARPLAVHRLSRCCCAAQGTPAVGGGQPAFHSPQSDGTRLCGQQLSTFFPLDPSRRPCGPIPALSRKAANPCVRTPDFQDAPLFIGQLSLAPSQTVCHSAVVGLQRSRVLRGCKSRNWRGSRERDINAIEKLPAIRVYLSNLNAPELGCVS